MRRAEGAPRAARTTGGSCVCVQFLFLEGFRVISGSTRPISSLRVGVFTQMALVLACARQKLKVSRLCLDGGEQCGLCGHDTERARGVCELCDMADAHTCVCSPGSVFCVGPVAVRVT